MNKALPFLFLLFLSCNNRECLTVNGDTKLFLYLSEQDKHCTYEVKSSFYNEVKGFLVMDNETIFLTLKNNPSSLDTFYSPHDSIGATRKIDIRYTDQLLGGIQKGSISSSLMFREDNYLVFRLSDILGFTSYKEDLNSYVFFDTNLGFIGSYLENPDESAWIINAQGNLLEDRIDYRHKRKRVNR